MHNLLFILPVLFIVLVSVVAVKMVKKGLNKKKALLVQICSVGLVMLSSLIICVSNVSASNNNNSNDSSVSNNVVSSKENNSENSNGSSLAFGIGLLAAALVTGLSGIGGGLAVASAAPAAIAATSEDPKAFGKALIFVALGEGIALYGLLVSILIFGQLDKLKL